jgi:hypothetical protein
VSTSNDQPPSAPPAPPASAGRLHSIVRLQPNTSGWSRRLSVTAHWITARLARPRVRLCLIGLLLLVLAALGVTTSVWTLPVVIVGIVMVVIAWIGSRLDGRFAVEWGETGTQLEFRARIRAPEAAQHALVAAPIPAARPPAVRIPQVGLSAGDVIEGQGRTVEIDVAELKALIAAAEAEDPARAPGQAPAASPSDRQRRPAA